MKKIVVNIALIFILAVLCAALAAVNILDRKDRSIRTCQGISIEFLDDYNFVTTEDIHEFLDNYYGAVIGMRTDEVDLARIEDILDVQTAVLKSEVYLEEDGILHIQVTQREPIVRFQKGSNGFYADGGGYIFPLQRNYTSPVPVIDGELPLSHETGYKGEPQGEKEKAWMDEIMELVYYLNDNRQWVENLVQISVDAKGEMIMIPREGRERFIFGECRDIEKKFEKMEKYYQCIKPLDKDYGTIIVKYDNQIICRN